MIYYKVYKDLEFVWVKVLKADKDEVLKFIDNLSQKDYLKSFSGIIDIRNAEININYKDVSKVAQISVSKEIALGHWAMLVDEPVSTALAELYRNEVKVAHPTKMFSTLDAAAQYIGIDINKLDINISEEELEFY